MSTDYLKVVYNEERTPKTSYPAKLAGYLSGRFSLKKNGTLLEVGCGRGDFLLAFKNLGFRCSGIDKELDTALSSQVELKKTNLESERFPFEDNTFDVVYHKSVIEHFYSAAHLMKETYRVLKPGGKVVVLTPDWVSQMKVFYEDPTHCRPYDTTSLADTFAMHGFKNVHAEKFHQLPVAWKFPPIKGIAAFLRIFFSTPAARAFSRFTGIKFFRWAVELMVLGVAEK